jgi:uncharacterized membrane protein
MESTLKQGRYFFAIAILALGVENLVNGFFHIYDSRGFPGEIVTAVIPWVSTSPWLAYFTGLLLIVGALAMISNARPRLAAAMLGILFLIFVIALEARRLANLGGRTIFFEPLAIAGSALTLAGLLPDESRGVSPDSQRWLRSLDWLIRLGPFFFAASCIDFGIDHLVFLRYVATLVPSFIPWHLFWTYFTAFAFIAAALSIATRWMGSWAGTMLGVMFLLWFVLLHLPRAFGVSPASGPGAPKNPNEWSSAFIALAMAGGSWVMGLHCLKNPYRLFQGRTLPAVAAD